MNRIIILICSVFFVFVASNLFSEVKFKKWYVFKHNLNGYFFIEKHVFENSATTIVFNIFIKLKNKKVSYIQEITAVCKNDSHYTPEHIEVTTKINNKKKSYMYTIQKSANGYKMFFNDYKYVEESKVTKGVMLNYILFIKLCELPFDKTKIFTYHRLEPGSYRVKKNHTIRYKGKEQVWYDGKKQALHKFFMSHGSYNCYVNDAHELVFAKIDGKVNSSTEKKAKEFYKSL